MSKQRFDEMSEAEFDALIEGHIARVAEGAGELPADVFVDLLLQRAAAAANTTLTLDVAVVDGEVVITPDRDAGAVLIQGNEIVIGGHRLVFKLAQRS